MEKREKEFNEVANACIVFQKEFGCCETINEALDMYKSINGIIFNQLAKRIEELNKESDYENSKKD